MSDTVLGIDIGGTGSRAALARRDESGALTIAETMTGPGVEIGPDGSTVLRVASTLVAAAAEAWPEDVAQIVGVGIGATGIASLAGDPSMVLAEISDRVGAPAAAAIDALTAHLGAFGGSGGAITVLGTGAIAIAHPGPDADGVMSAEWTRVDGWGHLFGDRGGGAWIGRRSLELAMLAFDGVDMRGRRLLESASAILGPPNTWPALFYTRNDRAALLASFAEVVAALAMKGDEVAAGLFREAGAEAARSALAATGRNGAATGRGYEPGTPPRIALTGGLVAAGEPLIAGFRDEATRLRSDVVIVESAGGPLEGCVTLARLAAEGRLRAQNSVVWL